MLAILNSLNAQSMPIFQPILMILVSKFIVHRALSDKTYLSLGLLSPLTYVFGAQKNRLIETVLLSTHNICFGGEIKLNFRYALITNV